MLGRTHLAIGVAAACLTFPTALHIHALHAVLSGNASQVLDAAEVVGASLMGSAAPDLDESHSLLAQKVEVVGRLVLLLVFVVLTLWAHLSLPPLAWGAWTLLAITLLARSNLARKVALLVLAAGALYAGFTGSMNLVSGVGLSLWCVGAAFTSHRTATHSLIGVSCLAPLGVWGATHGFMELVIGFFLGYALHLVADCVSGGVPLLYPFGRKRLGVRLVRSGSRVDQAIATLATGVAIVALLQS